jgi:hypothetical protein
MLLHSKYFILVPRAALSRILDLPPRQKGRKKEKEKRERKKYATRDPQSREANITGSVAPRSRRATEPVFLGHTTPESLVVDVGALLGP